MTTVKYDDSQSDVDTRVDVRMDIAPLRNGELRDGDIFELPGVGPVSDEKGKWCCGSDEPRSPDSQKKIQIRATTRWKPKPQPPVDRPLFASQE